MRAVLIRIDAKDRIGEPYPLRLSSINDSRVCHLDSAEWLAAIERLPRLRYDFFGGAFQNQLIAPQADFSVSVGNVDDFTGRNYASARTRIYEGEAGDGLEQYRLKFDGRIEGEPQIQNGVATLRAAPSDEWMDEPFLDVFAGTGGIEGTDDLTGQVKPKVFGHCQSAPGVLIDPVDLVYLVNDGPIRGTKAVKDRGADKGVSSGDYADLAALLAASIPLGGWATCDALGLVRLGAPADGRLSFRVKGDDAGLFVRQAGEIIARVAEIAGGTVDTANIASLDTAKPYRLELSYSAQTTARNIIQQIADSVGVTTGLLWTGELFVQSLEIDPSPDTTLATDGSGDFVIGSPSVAEMAAPFWRLATNAEPTYVVLSESEIATQFVLRGEYDSARQYRIDDAVFTDDGRTFVYINETPSIGNAPPAQPDTSNDWWSQEGSADKTVASQRTIFPQFPVVEVREFEAGNIGDRAVTHFIRSGPTTITGGTWSLPSVLLGLGDASITSGTGTVTLSDVEQSGSYTIRYTHTDGTPTDLLVNVNYLEQDALVRSITSSVATVGWFEGATTSVTVTHDAREGDTDLTGGTWTKIASTGGGTVTVNSTTGSTTITGQTSAGYYTIEYEHTDTETTTKTVNIGFYPSGDPGRPPFNSDWNEP